MFKDSNANGVVDVGTDVLVAVYRYDGLGRRITKLQPNGSNWDRTDYYYNEGWQCIEERRCMSQEGTGDVPAAVHVQWLWDPLYGRDRTRGTVRAFH